MALRQPIGLGQVANPSPSQPLVQEDRLCDDMRHCTDIEPIIEVNHVEITATADGGPLARALAGWPARLQPLAGLRIAWDSVQFEASVAFYRDLVGLPLLETFENSYGSSGAILGLPGPSLTLELVKADGPLGPHVRDRLCLYFPDESSRNVAIARFRAEGIEPLVEQHPYWSATGAVTFLDPDRREVVFAPFVYEPGA